MGRMSAAGWYPDPGGQSGMFRYWDGSAWSATLSPNPYVGPPASAHPGQLPVTTGSVPGAYPGAGQVGSPYAYDAGAARQRRPIGALALIAVVVIALIVGLVALFGNGSLNPFGGPGPVSNPTQDVCPKKKVVDPSQAPHVNPAGRVQGGKLSYPQLGAPWGAPQMEDRVPFGRDVYEQSVMVEENYDGLGSSWVASILVGELVAGDGFFSPKEGSEIVSRCIMGVFYADAVLDRKDVVNQATTVDGKDAWILEMHLGFNIPRLKEKGETAIIVIVATGTETSSIYNATIPDSRPELLATARSVQKQLRVEP